MLINLCCLFKKNSIVNIFHRLIIYAEFFSYMSQFPKETEEHIPIREMNLWIEVELRVTEYTDIIQ